MRSSASRLVLTIRRWGLMRCTATQPALTTSRRVGSGGPQAGSTPHVMFTRRRCYKTAWSLLQGDLIPIPIFPRAPNCTTRRAGPGLTQAASTPHVILTRRRCYETAWFLLQGELTQTAVLWRARNWDAVTAKIHWDGSKKRPSHLRSTVPK